MIFMHMFTHAPVREIEVESENRKEGTRALGTRLGMVSKKEGLGGQLGTDEGNWGVSGKE